MNVLLRNNLNIYHILIACAISGIICCSAWGISDANLPTVDVEEPTLYTILRPDLINFNTYDNFKVIEEKPIEVPKEVSTEIIPLPKSRPIIQHKHQVTKKKQEVCVFFLAHNKDGSCKYF